MKFVRYLLAVSMLIILNTDSSLAFELTSPAFKDSSLIPGEYTCDAANISPELNWKGAPEGTQSFVLLVEDPDAPIGTVDHWVVFNIPATVNYLEKAIATLPEGALAGINIAGESKYRGPCPPDKEHRYFFRLFALDKKLDLKEGVTKSNVQIAMSKNIIGRTTLIGRYDRPGNKKK